MVTSPDLKILLLLLLLFLKEITRRPESNGRIIEPASDTYTFENTLVWESCINIKTSLYLSQSSHQGKHPHLTTRRVSPTGASRSCLSTDHLQSVSGFLPAFGMWAVDDMD